MGIDRGQGSSVSSNPLELDKVDYEGTVNAALPYTPAKLGAAQTWTASQTYTRGSKLQIGDTIGFSLDASTTGGNVISSDSSHLFLKTAAPSYSININNSFGKTLASFSQGTGDVTLYAASQHSQYESLKTSVEGILVTGKVCPTANDAYDLGASGSRWDDVYATNGVIQTSDRNNKEDILDSDLGLDFINDLNPVSYTFIGEGNVRTHYGMIAQDVKETLGGKDFAGYIYNEENDAHGLRYTEFVAPLIKAIQELTAKVALLEAEVQG